jgi:hypothetical protein
MPLGRRRPLGTIPRPPTNASIQHDRKRSHSDKRSPEISDTDGSNYEDGEASLSASSDSNSDDGSDTDGSNYDVNSPSASKENNSDDGSNYEDGEASLSGSDTDGSNYEDGEASPSASNDNNHDNDSVEVDYRFSRKGDTDAAEVVEKAYRDFLPRVKGKGMRVASGHVHIGWVPDEKLEIVHL